MRPPVVYAKSGDVQIAARSPAQAAMLDVVLVKI